jgi:hypothetical protein
VRKKTKNAQNMQRHVGPMLWGLAGYLVGNVPIGPPLLFDISQSVSPGLEALLNGSPILRAFSKESPIPFREACLKKKTQKALKIQVLFSGANRS